MYVCLICMNVGYVCMNGMYATQVMYVVYAMRGMYVMDSCTVGVYVCNVCMYVCYACTYVMYVMYVMYDMFVCMYVCYVCML